MFKVKIVTPIGVQDDLKFYNHRMAFTRAIDLQNTNHAAFIEERQWCPQTNQLMTKTYYANNKSIYVANDADVPIYSLLPSFGAEANHRLFIHALLKKTISIYKYMGIKCPYTDEYFYSYGKNQLAFVQAQVMNDPYVRMFYSDALVHIGEIIDFVKLTDMPISEFILGLTKIEPEKLIDSLKEIKKSLKNFILKKVYGATYIDEYRL